MKIVVAYSGGLDTSVLVTWLKDTYSAEIIAFCADVGQEEELDGLEEKAIKTGASKCYIDDLREEFARDFIFPMVQASALYEGQYFLGTSIARPLIAKRMVEIAAAEGADAVAHGATGKGNDQVRFELTAAALAPDLEVIAPWRQERFREQFPGRSEMIAYAEANQIPIAATAKKSYSMDRNLLHISFESGILEDPWFDASTPEHKDMYKLSVSPEDAPDSPEYVELDFEKGDCVAVNGKALSPLGVMLELNRLGGKHGIGRVDMVENRFVGMKSRGVYETPRRRGLEFCASPDGIHHHGSRSHAPARFIDSEIQHAGLQWILVCPRTGSPSGARDRVAKERERHRARETLQRQPHRRWSEEPIEPLQSGHCDHGSRSDAGLQSI